MGAPIAGVLGSNFAEGTRVRLMIWGVVKVAAFAMSLSLIQRSPTGCVCV